MSRADRHNKQQVTKVEAVRRQRRTDKKKVERVKNLILSSRDQEELPADRAINSAAFHREARRVAGIVIVD